MHNSAVPSVLFINRVYPPVRGATGRMLRDLAVSFAAQGWRVTVLTTGPKAGQENDGAVRVIRIRSPRKGKNSLTYMRVWAGLFFKALRLPRHDLIVTMTDPPLLVVAGERLAKIKKSHHIHWCQDVYPDLLPALGVNFSKWWEQRLKLISRRALKRCDKVVVIGRCMAQHLIRSGIAPGHIVVIPNWPDGELLPEGAVRSSLPQKRRKVIKKAKNARPFKELLRDGQESKFRVLYAGNMGRAHPLRAILQAAEILNKNNHEIEFVFVGNGINFERLSQERSKRGLENIRLLPYQPLSRLRDVMESGDVHLITMRQETCGLLVPCKLYSAFATARPCLFIGPEDSEAARVIKDFKAGSVIAPGDGRALAQKILRYRNDSDAWFAAHEGAAQAGKVFLPEESIAAFIKRALAVVRQPRP